MFEQRVFGPGLRQCSPRRDGELGVAGSAFALRELGLAQRLGRSSLLPSHHERTTATATIPEPVAAKPVLHDRSPLRERARPILRERRRTALRHHFATRPHGVHLVNLIAGEAGLVVAARPDPAIAAISGELTRHAAEPERARVSDGAAKPTRGARSDCARCASRATSRRLRRRRLGRASARNPSKHQICRSNHSPNPPSEPRSIAH